LLACFFCVCNEPNRLRTFAAFKLSFCFLNDANLPVSFPFTAVHNVSYCVRAILKLVRLHHKSFVGGERDEFLTRMNFTRTRPRALCTQNYHKGARGGGVQIHALISSSFDGFLFRHAGKLELGRVNFFYIFCSAVLKKMRCCAQSREDFPR
jgi:hypothetical protein